MGPILQLLLIVALPPLLLGVIVKTKAAFAGRVGAPVLQPWLDVLKLARKGMVFSRTTSWVFRAGPLVSLAAIAVAALAVPVAGSTAILAFPGDLLLVAYLFALARFFTVCAALDTGSAFEGMGGAREAAFACLAEPAFFFSLLALVKVSGCTSLSDMLGAALVRGWPDHATALVLVAVSLFVVLLAESCRIPFDDPNTHLELTMIHEVMVLDHSGPLLALVHLGAGLKLFLLGALVVRILLPVDTGMFLLDAVVFVLALVLLAVAVGAVESIMARLRLKQVPTLLVAACLLAAFGLGLLVG